MGWWVGCIKLPYSRLSGVTEPRGFLLFLIFFTEGEKKRKKEEVEVSLVKIYTSSSFRTILVLLRSFSSGLIQPAAEGGIAWNRGKAFRPCMLEKKATPKDFIIIRNCWSTSVFIVLVVIVNLLCINNFSSEKYKMLLLECVTFPEMSSYPANIEDQMRS